jgi:hypothetical protein
MNIEEIRAELSVLPRRANGNIYRVPEVLRQEVVSVAKESQEPRVHVARALGLSPSVIATWSKSKKASKSKFKTVQVIGEKSEECRWMVEGNSGLKVRGLTIGELAELFQRLELR